MIQSTTWYKVPHYTCTVHRVPLYKYTVPSHGCLYSLLFTVFSISVTLHLYQQMWFLGRKKKNQKFLGKGSHTHRKWSLNLDPAPKSTNCISPSFYSPNASDKDFDIKKYINVGTNFSMKILQTCGRKFMAYFSMARAGLLINFAGICLSLIVVVEL